MACSVATRCVLANPVTRVRDIPRFTQIRTTNTNYVPCLQRNVSLRVRCMEKQKGQKEESSTPITIPPPPSFTLPSTTLPNTTPPELKVSSNFSDNLAFSGPALPERINGRLAMIGFVTAMAVELSNGQDVFTQVSNGGLPWFVGTTVVLSLASLIPLFKGVTVQSKSDGVMTADAELWNGRAAMFGFAALIFTEFVKGGALV